LKKSAKNSFLVLIPHRDVRGVVRKCSERLVKDGLNGVYPFPWVLPLATLSQPLNIEELKCFAHSLRGFVGTAKICVGQAATTLFPTNKNKMELLGWQVDLDIPTNIFEVGGKKLESILSPMVIGSFLFPSACEQQIDAVKQKLNSSLREGLSFRAAAVANLSWRSFDADGEIGYKWKIGKLCWLPAKK